MSSTWKPNNPSSQTAKGEIANPCAKSWASVAPMGLTIDSLPDIVLVEHLAQLLHCSEKAVRSRVSEGQLPKPFPSGKRLAWMRDDIRAWLSERTRVATRPPVRIVITNYKYKGQDRLQAIWKMNMNVRIPVHLGTRSAGIWAGVLDHLGGSERSDGLGRVAWRSV